MNKDDQMFFYLIGKAEKPEGILPWLPDTLTMTKCWECNQCHEGTFYLCDECDNKLDNSAHRDGEIT